MSQLSPDLPADHVRSEAHARMSDIFDRAAEAAGVSPEEFRAAIHEAMRYANVGENRISDVTPEAFALTLLGTLL